MTFTRTSTIPAGEAGDHSSSVGVFSREMGLLPRTTQADWVNWRNELSHVIVCGLRFVLERRQGCYPYFDTKYDVPAGKDFSEGDALRGRGTIFSWIQSRGLEAVSLHLRWLESDASLADGNVAEMLSGGREFLREVLHAMEIARERNEGRLPFMMNPDGARLRMTESGKIVGASEVSDADQASSLSDLFYARGLAASASLLGEDRKLLIAEEMFRQVVGDLQAGRFYSGQEALDPNNPVQTVPGKISHAGWMIGLGACTLFYDLTGKDHYRELGLQFIRHVLDRHASPRSEFRKGDFWEFVTPDGSPWRDDSGRVWSDPGHATEFVGLALAHLHQTSSLRDHQLIDRLCGVLLQNFGNGFSGRGIVKAFDLMGRRAINPDMPWWSLPETMRAASLAALLKMDSAEEMEIVLSVCWQAFVANFLRPDRGWLAVQCLDSDGRVSAAIPATPDLDPGYHTGLSLLGCLPFFDQKIGGFAT